MADYLGRTPLWHACHKGKLAEVKRLYNNGAKNDVTKADIFGRTPTWEACLHKHFDIMKWLYDNSAKEDVTKADNNGQTPMLIACRYNKLDIVKWLYKNGAKEDATKANNNGQTPMWIACRYNRLDIMKWLYDNGAKDYVTKADNNGQTPMWIACCYNKSDIMEWLYDNGAKDDITKANNDGQTPIQIATSHNNLDIVSRLSYLILFKENEDLKNENKYLKGQMKKVNEDNIIDLTVANTAIEVESKSRIRAIFESVGEMVKVKQENQEIQEERASRTLRTKECYGTFNILNPSTKDFYMPLKLLVDTGGQAGTQIQERFIKGLGISYVKNKKGELKYENILCAGKEMKCKFAMVNIEPNKNLRGCHVLENEEILVVPNGTVQILGLKQIKKMKMIIEPTETNPHKKRRVEYE